MTGLGEWPGVTPKIISWCVCHDVQVHVPEGLTLMDLDTIRLVAQFVARNGKNFLTGAYPVVFPFPPPLHVASPVSSSLHVLSEFVIISMRVLALRLVLYVWCNECCV